MMVRLIARCALALGLAALTSPPAVSQGGAGDRPALRVAVNGLPHKLDPADNPLTVDLRVTASVFDTLIKRDYAAESQDPNRGVVLVPSLAGRWSRIDDRTLELELRKGVKFHNGDEFTSEDVAYTFSDERIFGPKAYLPAARRYLGQVDRVEAIDRYHVRIHTTLPDPVLELRLTTWPTYIVNARAYKERGPDGFSRSPVGTGPMKLSVWKPGNQMVFLPNDDYFGGRPSFSSITFYEVPEAAARLSGLISGEFDLAVPLNPDQIAVLKGSRQVEPRISLIEQPQLLFVSGLNGDVKNKLIRQALARAIDRDRISKILLNGTTEPEVTFQYRSFGPLFDPSRRGLAFDAGAAKSLLAQAGYSGNPITLRVVGNYYPNGETIAQAIQAMWIAIGVKVKLEIVENFAQAYAPGWSAVLGGCAYLMPSPEGMEHCFFSDESFANQRGFPNGVGNLKPMLKSLAFAGDVSQRRQIFQDMLDVLEDEVPAIPLYRVTQIYGASKKLRWQPSAELGMDFRPNKLSVGQP